MGFIVPPSKWEVQHAKQIFAAQSYQSANNGQLPNTRVWRMLELRHDLNPTRFNFYHPNVSRMFDGTPTPPAEQVVRGWEGHMRDPDVTPPPVIDPPIIPPVIDPPLNPPVPQVVVPPTPVTPQVVPEPAAFLMFAVAMLTMGLFFQRARRKPR